MQRLWESIFGLKRGFLDQPGELSIGFNPKWPTEPLINLGPMNWLLGLIALVALGYLFLRVHPDRKPHGWRRWIGAGTGVLAVLVIGKAWSPWAALAMALFVAAMEWRGPWYWKLWMARSCVVAFFFSLLSGTVAFNISLSALALSVILYVYPREGRSTPVRFSLGVIRAA